MSNDRDGDDDKLKELETLAASLTSHKSIVDTWLTHSNSNSSKSTVSLPVEYTNTSTLARPSRLGIGAKPQHQKALQDTIFGNYKLRMQLTGHEQLPGSDGNLLPISGNKSKVQTNKLARPTKNHGSDDDDDSRAKSLGKRPKIHNSSGGLRLSSRKSRKRRDKL